MGLSPNITKKTKFVLKVCSHCGQSFGADSFAPTKSLFYPDGVIPICNDCIDKILRAASYDWDMVNRMCQYADIPFVPKEWERLREMSETDLFYRYATIFQSSEYENLGWGDYFREFQKLKQQNALEEELPGLSEEKARKLKEKWGANYDDEALAYLENLYNGVMATQNVNGDLQVDQAKKICKMSYEIDRKIAEGSDFDKLLASYDKLVKTAEFTPRNVKNINDFDSFGEAAVWLEKNGWRNKFFDNVSRDIVDETIKNFQSFNQRLYTNESSMAEEINRRIESLKSTSQLEKENYYETDKDFDLEKFEQDGYNELLHPEEDEFKLDLEEDNE